MPLQIALHSRSAGAARQVDKRQRCNATWYQVSIMLEKTGAPRSHRPGAAGSREERVATLRRCAASAHHQEDADDEQDCADNSDVNAQVQDARAKERGKMLHDSED